VVPPYVLRAMPGASVSAPPQWHKVTDTVDPARFNLNTIIRRLARQKQDPMRSLLER
jgi:bifunctional non-homologous end joining protein LigD